jgi:hypothetical protein
MKELERWAEGISELCQEGAGRDEKKTPKNKKRRLRSSSSTSRAGVR